MSDNARAIGERLIRQCEGCVLTPYADVGGTWTIGVGSIYLLDGSRVTKSTPAITQDEADALLLHELTPTCDAVDGFVTVAATDGQLAALYSFAYNEGVHALATSTLLRLFNAGDTAGASAQFAHWNLVKGVVFQGLVNRRNLEKAVFDGVTVP